MRSRLIRKPLIGSFIVLFALIAIFLMFRVPSALYLCYAALAGFAASRLKNRGFIVFLVLGSFAIRFLYVNVVHTPPESDFKLLYDSAVLFSKGDYSFSQLSYFRQWGYQTGFVAYEGLIVMIFGEAYGIYALKALNCVWSTGITLLIYLMARNHFKENSARFAGLAYMGLAFPVTFVSVLTNQHISAFLIALGLFFLIDKKYLGMKPVPRALVSGLFIALGNVMRPEGIIIMGSLAVYFLVLLIKAEKGRRKEIVLRAAVLFGLFLALTILFSRIIMVAGVNEFGLNNRNVYWKFVLGLNHESKGTYNNKDVEMVFHDGLTEDEMIELEKNLIRQRLSAGPARLGVLLLNKVQELWCDNALDWSYGYILERGTPVRLLCFWVEPEDVDVVLQGIQGMFMFTVLTLCLAGAVRLLRNDADEPVLIYFAVLVLSTIVYFAVEVQPRYVYLQEIFLFILSAAGADVILERLEISGLKAHLKKFIGMRG